MEYRKLGNTDLNVSVIGMGTWATGKLSWGDDVNDDESIRYIQAALDNGINLIDTADAYGDGHAEKIVGEAIKGRREETLIATKGGVIIDSDNNYRFVATTEHILKAIDESLRRLKTDYVDLYQIHWPDGITPEEETYQAMEEIKQSGKARWIGCCNYGVDLLEKIADVGGHYSSIQPNYNLLQREIEGEILPYANKHNLGVLAYGSLCTGLLTGKFDKNSTFPKTDYRSSDYPEFQHPEFQGERYLKNLEAIERMCPIAQKYGKTLAQVAIRWCIQQPGVSSALVGAKRVDQIMDNLGAVGWELSQEDLSQLTQISDDRTK